MTHKTAPALVTFRLLRPGNRLGVARLGWLTYASGSLAHVVEVASHIPRILRGAEVQSIKAEEGRNLSPPPCVARL